MNEIHEITPTEVARRLDEGENLELLDVREPFELNFVRLPHARHIPMRQIPSQLGELDRTQDLVIVCHHGIRSAQVCAYLEHHGFDRVFNLTGGIDAWSLEVDPQLPRY